jgi:hypothetical protein
VGGRAARERLRRELGAQHARLGLEEHELEVVAAEAREQLRRLLGRQVLDRDALRPHGPRRRGLPAVA